MAPMNRLVDSDRKNSSSEKHLGCCQVVVQVDPEVLHWWIFLWLSRCVTASGQGEKKLWTIVSSCAPHHQHHLNVA